MKKLLKIGCLVLPLVGCFGLLGVTVGGFSIGTWLVAIGLMSAAPEHNPSVMLALRPRGIEVVQVSSTQVKQPFPVKVRLTEPSPEDPTVVLVSDTRPTTPGLIALKDRQTPLTLGEQVEGVGTVIQLVTETGTVDAAATGAYVTLLGGAQGIDTSLEVDLYALRTACDCKARVTFTQVATAVAWWSAPEDAG